MYTNMYKFLITKAQKSNYLFSEYSFAILIHSVISFSTPLIYLCTHIDFNFS